MVRDMKADQKQALTQGAEQQRPRAANIQGHDMLQKNCHAADGCCTCRLRAVDKVGLRLVPNRIAAATLTMTKHDLPSQKLVKAACTKLQKNLPNSTDRMPRCTNKCLRGIRYRLQYKANRMLTYHDTMVNLQIQA